MDGALSFAADTPETFSRRLHLGPLGREADGCGVACQADRLESGATSGQVARGVADSPEHVGNAGGVPSERAFVDALHAGPAGETHGTAAALLAVTASAEFAAEARRATGDHRFG